MAVQQRGLALAAVHHNAWARQKKPAIGPSLRARLDHTLITRWASVGVIAQNRAGCIHLKSATYDWFGLLRTARTGFDSRWCYHLFIMLWASCSRFLYAFWLVLSSIHTGLLTR